MAVSVVVGQQVGRDRPDLAQRGAYSGFHMTFLYMATIAALYVFVPGIFIKPFEAHADPASFEAIRPISLVLLRFAAVFCIFDTMNLIFSAAIKGAGDTRFVMCMLLIMSVCVLIIPSYIAMAVLGGGIYVGWTIATMYICLLGFAYFGRFLGGKWKSMRVIETVVHAVPQTMPEAPTASVEP